MRTVQAFKAQPLGGQVPRSITILLDQPFPESGPNLTESARDRIFELDAANLAAALWAALPGGTFDRLLGEMLHRRASVLTVTHRQPTLVVTPVEGA